MEFGGKKALAGLVFLIAYGPSSLPAVAKEAEFKQVVATGIGIDENAATKNALMAAVEQAVGAVVDAETVVKNDEIIKDELLTYSNGFVKRFEEIKSWEEGGLKYVKIHAWVEMRRLTAKLEEHKISVKKVAGKSLFGEAATKVTAAQNAAAMVKKSLEGLPSSLLFAEVIGDPNILKPKCR